MMKVAIYLFLIACSVSCSLFKKSTGSRDQIAIPKELKHIEPKIIETINNTATSKATDYYLTKVIVKKDNIGIYSFSGRRVQSSYYYVFMYNGDSTIFTTLTDSIGMCQFLEKNNFSKWEIEKWDRRVKFLNKDREEMHKALVW